VKLAATIHEAHCHDPLTSRVTRTLKEVVHPFCVVLYYDDDINVAVVYREL